MKEKELKNEGLADLAHKVEKDHEVDMARSDLYKLISVYASTPLSSSEFTNITRLFLSKGPLLS